MEVVRNTLAKVRRTKVTVKSLCRIKDRKWGMLVVLIWNSLRLKPTTVSLLVSIISITINKRKLTNNGSLFGRVIWMRIQNQANMRKMTATNVRCLPFPVNIWSLIFPIYIRIMHKKDRVMIYKSPFVQRTKGHFKGLCQAMVK